jgi:hypothetical protein
VNVRKCTSRRNPLLFFNTSTCVAIAKSIHKMHITIFHVWKHKRQFSNSAQLTYQPFTTRLQRTLKQVQVQWSPDTAHKDNTISFSADRYSAWTRQKTTLFSSHYLRNRSTLDMVFWVLSVYFNIRNTLLKSGRFLLEHPVCNCTSKTIIVPHIWIHFLYFSKKSIFHDSLNWVSGSSKPEQSNKQFGGRQCHLDVM